MTSSTRFAARAGALALLALAGSTSAASAASYPPASCVGQAFSHTSTASSDARSRKTDTDAGEYPDVPLAAKGPGVYAVALAHDPDRRSCGRDLAP